MSVSVIWSISVLMYDHICICLYLIRNLGHSKVCLQFHSEWRDAGRPRAIPSKLKQRHFVTWVLWHVYGTSRQASQYQRCHDNQNANHIWKKAVHSWSVKSENNNENNENRQTYQGGITHIGVRKLSHNCFIGLVPSGAKPLYEPMRAYS